MNSKNNSIGILQGRLTQPKGRGIQFFPFENWQQEFEIAASLGLSEIAFIFDLENYQENPLWTDEGQQRINSLIRETGVKVNRVLADYFMRKPFFRVISEEQQKSITVLKKLIVSASAIGAKNLEIPLVDDSSMTTAEDEADLIDTLNQCSSEIKENNITISLELDYPPRKFYKLLQKINLPWVGVTYDSGNSAALGFDCVEEISILKNHLFNIHIKDRLYQGTTVPLGTGNADFDALFKILKEINYQESFILQVAREAAGNEFEIVKKQIDFVRRYIA